MRGTLEQRLWAKIDKRGPDECWPWLAFKYQGYGRIGRGKSGAGNMLAHRAVYELVVGPIPDGLELDHTCHKADECEGGSNCPHRGCCNPAHLEPVTDQVNTARGNSGRRYRERTHCPRGHEYTPENTNRRMNNGYLKRYCRACRRK